MTRIPTPDEAIQKIVAEYPRFDTEAYEFVVEAMEAAFSEWSAKHADMKMPSKQLVVALQRLASERFGKCVTATFNLWGITSWQDFAEIVSRMQEAKAVHFLDLVFNKEDFRGRGVLDDVFPEI